MSWWIHRIERPLKLRIWSEPAHRPIVSENGCSKYARSSFCHCGLAGALKSGDQDEQGCGNDAAFVDAALVL